MKLFFRIACLVLLLSGARAQDLGFDLADALDDVVTPKPKSVDPPKEDNPFDGFNLEDAFGAADPTPAKPKPPVNNNPSRGGGGGGISDSDLKDIFGGGEGGGDHYKPDPGQGGGDRYGDGGRYGGGDPYQGGGEGPAYNPAYDDHSGGGQQDGAFEWGHILKMLNANMPEDFFLWMSNVKQRLAPLLERVLELLNTLPEDEQQEL